MLYYRSKMEQFAEYLNQDGLVTCLTVYADTERELVRGTLEPSLHTANQVKLIRINSAFYTQRLILIKIFITNS